LPIDVCEATATAPTVAPAPIKNFLRAGLFSSETRFVDLSLIANSFVVHFDI